MADAFSSPYSPCFHRQGTIERQLGRAPQTLTSPILILFFQDHLTFLKFVLPFQPSGVHTKEETVRCTTDLHFKRRLKQRFDEGYKFYMKSSQLTLKAFSADVVSFVLAQGKVGFAE